MTNNKTMTSSIKIGGWSSIYTAFEVIAVFDGVEYIIKSRERIPHHYIPWREPDEVIVKFR